MSQPNAVVDSYGIDYTQPVFAQLESLGDRYWEWSHVHVTPAFRRELAAARPEAPYPDSFPIFAGNNSVSTFIYLKNFSGLLLTPPPTIIQSGDNKLYIIFKY